MNDLELIQRARSGEEEAFQELIERYYRTVQKFAFQIGVHPPYVEDVTQEVFLKVYRSISTFSGGTFTTWLYSITLNAARDLIRKEKRQKRNLQAMKEKDNDKMFDELETGEETWELHDMIRSLPEKYRIPLILHYFHEQTYREISKVTGVTETAVKTRVMRARNQLKKRYEKAGVLHE
ncbi:RNA polymerase sigma factor [Alteribacillus sp. YIM 98480]|uniref:RNA polymerase sigma factor n=1 Tax=Alteribacillus sp. YIM 98480 TaxID=2606599 RepID=UPI00131CA50C|nr:RNA polymerase sigma factor [Alteribacillus sp. YIM 98480]